MPSPFDELLATPNGSPLIAFTCYDLEVAEAVLATAEDRRRAVLLLVSAQAFATRGGPRLMSALVAVCAQCTVPAGVQLDHCRNREQLHRAADLGACAVMADGSALPFGENRDFVRAVVDELPFVSVEGELGRLTGEEDIATIARAGQLTEPNQAAEFAETTQLHALAVSIGNVHGEYHGVPALDWERLDAISRSVEVPLTLHGASGLPPTDIQRALSSGIRKINVNTELRKAYLSAAAPRAGWDVLGLHQAQTAEVATVVNAWLDATAPPTLGSPCV